MRGSAQAHLLECDNGFFYVVKFSNNPQGGRRVLDNELVSSLLMKRLGIHTPEIAVVNLDREFFKGEPRSPSFSRIESTAMPEIGPHFGSRHVGGPVPATVFDFLPSAMLPEVVNRGDFLGVMAFDKWVSNADGRQAVFYRARISSEMPGYPSVGWVAQFIDNGLAFQGRDWTFYDSPVQGIYRQRIVYGRRPSLRDFDPWVSAIMEIDQEMLDGVFMMLPSNWIEGQEYEFRQVVKQLCDRRERYRSSWLTPSNASKPMPAQGVLLAACCA